VEDLTKLKIYEAAASDGPWGAPIEEVTDVGSYPDYIDHYTTALALSKVNWFTIIWEDSKGAETDRSNPIQGGADDLVSEIMDLVEERDHTLDTQVVRQETEFLLEQYYHIDPYTATEDSYMRKIGLARLVQARVMLNRIASSSSSSGWTAGLVSMKSGGSADKATVIWLLEEAAKGLGWNYARVAQMATMVIAGGMSSYENYISEPILIEVE
jgi:hypothetical protein